MVKAEVARLLADTAGRLVDAGTTADTLSTDQLSTVPGELTAALSLIVRRPDRTAGWRCIHGLLDGFGRPGPTPPNWADALSERTCALDIALLLVAHACGRGFGWVGQQDGRLVHNIMPSRGSEHLQVGASSTTPLLWHSEDAFHPRRAELLLLACMRNVDQLGSQVSSVRRAGLSATDIDLLGRPLVAILPDASYPTAPDGPPEPVGVPTIWRGADGACLRYDPSYSHFLTVDPEFLGAYQRLGTALNHCAEVVPLQQGDILLIDNDVAVHGRMPFQPRYDGTDRWLKRVLIRLARLRPAAEQDEEGYGAHLVEMTAGAVR